MRPNLTTSTISLGTVALARSWANRQKRTVSTWLSNKGHKWSVIPTDHPLLHAGTPRRWMSSPTLLRRLRVETAHCSEHSRLWWNKPPHWPATKAEKRSFKRHFGKLPPRAGRWSNKRGSNKNNFQTLVAPAPSFRSGPIRSMRSAWQTCNDRVITQVEISSRTLWCKTLPPDPHRPNLAMLPLRRHRKEVHDGQLFFDETGFIVSVVMIERWETLNMASAIPH